MAPSPGAERPVARVGLFGGTFDPPHVGHVRVVTDVADALGLDRVVWIPAGEPPHKSASGITEASVRLEMAAAAAEADPRFSVSSVEIDRGGISYTADTVRAMRDAHPSAELYLVMGVDQYRDFDRWRTPEEILRHVTLAVMDRDGDSARSLRPEVVQAADGPAPVTFVPVRRVDISSTRVREAVALGEDVSAWLPAPVLDVVSRRGLYRPAPLRA